MGRSVFRRALSLKNGLRLLIALGIAVACGLVAKVWWDSQVFRGYDPDLALEAKVVSRGELEGFPIEKIEFTGLAGERIPVRLIVPRGAPGEKFPCVIFLYGIGQNARFFERIAPIFAEAGFAMAMPEQFQCGERRKRGIGILREALALRERSSRIVPETRRLVDLLCQRPEIDPNRISLIGASYGGITACSVLAYEPRLTNAALVMAGGDLPRLLKSLAKSRKPDSRILAPAVASAAAWLLRPFEPLDYVARASPRPLLFLEVKNDEMIDPACGRMLFERAQEPKSRRLYDDAHNTISEATVRQMLSDALTWLQSQN
jgi:dienelactone hydrolase